MIFLKPTIDIAFKKLFSNEQHINIVIGFINSVLDKKEGEKVVSVVINNPHNFPKTENDKSSIVDVVCTDQAGAQYIIEMQVANQDFFIQRAQYYTACAFANQLQKSERYCELKPVIFIGVLGFNLFDSPDYLHHHYILDSKTHKRTLAHKEWHFIELKKFNKTIKELDNEVDQWIYFLKNAQTHDDIPQSLEKIKDICDAFGVLERMKWDSAEYAVYWKLLDRARVAEDERSTAERLGREAGLERGMEKGIEEGMKKGMQKGIEKGRQEIALELLKTTSLDFQQIAQITKLSVEIIEQLKKKNN